MVKCGLCKSDKPFLIKFPIEIEDGKKEVRHIKIGEGQEELCVDCVKREVGERIQ